MNSHNVIRKQQQCPSHLPSLHYNLFICFFFFFWVTLSLENLGKRTTTKTPSRPGNISSPHVSEDLAATFSHSCFFPSHHHPRHAHLMKHSGACSRPVQLGRDNFRNWVVWWWAIWSFKETIGDLALINSWDVYMWRDVPLRVIQAKAKSAPPPTSLSLVPEISPECMNFWHICEAVKPEYCLQDETKKGRLFGVGLWLWMVW